MNLLLSATYFYSIPDSSDDDRAGSSHDDDLLTSVNHNPRRLRSRIPSVPMSFCTQRKHLGKKRSRRYDNGSKVVEGKYSIYSILDI